MTNTLTLTEVNVTTLIGQGWQGINLYKSPTPAGTYVLVTTIPFVLGIEQYIYVDSAGAATDWYRIARYAPLGLISEFSNPWPARAGTTFASLRQTVGKIAAGIDGTLVSAASSGQNGAGSSLTDASSKSLSQSDRNKAWEGGWLLRPGLGSGSPDRQRLVWQYTSLTGTYTPDSPWAIAPVAGETFEVYTVYDPSADIEAAIRRGLMKCRFVDNVRIDPLPQVGNAANNVDLTQWYPWLGQIFHFRAIRNVDSATGFPTRDSMWSRPYMRGGDLWVEVDGTFTGNYWLEVLRPYGTVVNGQDSLVGPIEDADVTGCPLDWAVAAAMTELIKGQGPFLSGQENQDLREQLKMWAGEFSRLSRLYLYEQLQTRQMLSMRPLNVGQRSW